MAMGVDDEWMTRPAVECTTTGISDEDGKYKGQDRT